MFQYSYVPLFWEINLARHNYWMPFRDIKGANILVDPNGRVKLADFGMAKHVRALTSCLYYSFFIVINKWSSTWALDILTWVEYTVCTSTMRLWFLILLYWNNLQINGQSCPLSFKGSPYWMAPEVSMIFLSNWHLFVSDAFWVVFLCVNSCQSSRL